MATEDSTPALPAPDLSISPNPSTTPPFAPRKLTVSHIDPGVSYLRLKGRWLDQAGFASGTHVRVEVSHRRLIVEAVELTEAAQCAAPNCPAPD